MLILCGAKQTQTLLAQTLLYAFGSNFHKTCILDKIEQRNSYNNRVDSKKVILKIFFKSTVLAKISYFHSLVFIFEKKKTRL